MRKKLMSLFLLMFSASTAGLSAQCCPPPECCTQPDCCFVDDCSKPWTFKTQVGLALEERPAFVDCYLFVNQLINGHWFYELRAVGIYNLIVNNPPVTVHPAPPHPIVKDERNQWGYGGVAILGYVFDITDKVSFMPYFRFQAFANGSTTYRDKFHNAIDTASYFYLFGGKLNMKVTDAFSMYVTYFGGPFRANFKGKGYFADTDFVNSDSSPSASSTHPRKHVHFDGLFGTLEFGFPYTFDVCLCNWKSTWCVTPYIQFIISDNNPAYPLTQKPYSLSRLTSSNVLYAFRVASQF